MDNQQRQPAIPQSQLDPEPSPAQQLGQQLRKGLDRLGFEADKLLRSNRIRSEANRLQEQADEKIYMLGSKVLEMSDRGVALEPELQTLVSQIKRLEAELGRKKKEVEAISSEAWVEPEPPPALRQPPPRPALEAPKPSQSAQPAPRSQRNREQPASRPGRQAPAAPVSAANEQERFCPNCKASVRPQAAFCANCGYKLS